jgi:single-stranded-DNA-specific exonuclease
MKQNEWVLKKFDKELSYELAYECEVPKPVANILVSRGITNKEDALAFIEKSPKNMRSPKNLPDCKVAIERLKKAILNKEKIFVWGDYDVDGITATAIVVTCFRLFGANFVYKVPNRFDDGYDIKRHSVDECIKEGCSLLMTVDCGIVAFDTAEYAKEKNIDVIITDHHTANTEGRIPNAIAVVNPSRQDSEYGFSGLCGASVAFKLMLALGKLLDFDLNKIVNETLEYVALGTVADVAPMIDENRILVNLGCKSLSNTEKPGMRELLKIARVTEVDTTSIGFQLGPRINAIGRLSDPMIALELMLENTPQRAKFLAMQLDTANTRRQSKQETMLNEAIDLIEEEKLYEKNVIVCWAKTWHEGLVGLVAGKLADKYHKPAIVLVVNPEKGYAKGSARSLRDINILDCLKHKNVIDLYFKQLDGSPVVGGHAFAAGMSITIDNLETFRDKLSDVFAELNSDFKSGKRILIADSIIFPGDITEATYDSLQGLAPFGSGHPEPVFWLKNVTVSEQSLMKDGKHLKLVIADEKLKFKKTNANLWHKAQDYLSDYVDKKVDILFTFGKDNKGYGQKFYLNVIDFKLS